MSNDGLPLQDSEDAADAPGEQEYEVRHLLITAEMHGERLDKALALLVPELSRSYLQQLIAQGAVCFRGQAAAKPSVKVAAGDALQVEMRPTEQSQAFRPEPGVVVDVLYEDDHLLVVNKPAGLVVHPAPGNWSGTLLNGLLARDVAAQQLPRGGIVHRLDKDTSGLMVVARSRAAMEGLVRRIAGHEVNRRYWALTPAPWKHKDQVRVDAPIGRDPRDRLRMAVVDLGRHPGKTARTDFQVLAQSAQACLVRCVLHTGRTHQIRVHMAYLGHPLWSDVLYGGVVHPGLQRQALHAYSLEFEHPVTGEAMAFHAPMADDLRRCMGEWGLDLQSLA